MSAAKRKVEEGQGPIASYEIVDRPISSRGKHEIDEEVKVMLKAMEEGKAVRLHLRDGAQFHTTHMSFRYAMQKFGARFRYKRVDDKTLIAWAEKVGKLVKALLMAWTLYELGPNGILGRPLAQFPDKDTCVLASYRASFATGVETRCGERGI